MKYFLDTEFIEGTQEKRIFGFKQNIFLSALYGMSLLPLVVMYASQVSYWLLIPIAIMYAIGKHLIERLNDKKPNTIDLISIGIVSGNGREFYEVSKDFNLVEAWNRWQQRTGQGDKNNHEPKEYWIRENVLLPIFKEFLELERESLIKQRMMIGHAPSLKRGFSIGNFNRLLKKYGKSNKEIAENVKDFCLVPNEQDNIEFYAYYGSYDWVVFCWLFGKMINLPKGFPMFFHDLKVMFDEAAVDYFNELYSQMQDYDKLDMSDSKKIKRIKELENYPMQENLHNALDDAKWNLVFFKYIESIK